MATDDRTAKPAKSKTQQVLDHMAANPTASVRATAKLFGVDPASIYRRMKRLAETAESRCPCCGQIIKGSK